jgi:hypothetical protein
MVAEGLREARSVYDKGLLELVERLHDLAYDIEADERTPLRINPQKTVTSVITVTSVTNPLT